MSDDALALLAALGGRATDRKLRLFASACCRLVWDALPFDACRRAVELGEQFADNLVPGHELAAAYRELNQLVTREHGCRARLAQATALLLRPHFRVVHAQRVVEWARNGRIRASSQTELFRDIFGDVLQGSVRLPGAGTRTAVLAAFIYRERCFDLMPALADTEPVPDEVEAHCRAHTTHVRGCWVIDWAVGL